MGSWKTMDIFRPRIRSISRSLFCNRFSPSKKISPLTISPGGGIRRKIESEVTLLPQPVSPTIPKVSLSCSEKERSWIARQCPALEVKLNREISDLKKRGAGAHRWY